HAEDRAHCTQDLSHAQRSQGGCLRLHRALLQSETAALDDRLHQPHPVRAADASNLRWCLRDRQQPTSRRILAVSELAGAPDEEPRLINALPLPKFRARSLGYTTSPS